MLFQIVLAAWSWTMLSCTVGVQKLDRWGNYFQVGMTTSNFIVSAYFGVPKPIWRTSLCGGMWTKLWHKMSKVCIFVEKVSKHLLIFVQVLRQMFAQLMSVPHYNTYQLYAFEHVLVQVMWHKRGLSWPQNVQSMHFCGKKLKHTLIFGHSFVQISAKCLHRVTTHTY